MAHHQFRRGLQRGLGGCQRGGGPLAYAAMMRTGQLADPIIARCQEWAAQHYEEEAPVSAMVRISGLPERTFQRRFALATGLT
ncbi:hypothetical protein LZ631_20435, partial [Pseudomonas stutzeri]|nr:hypothetical protein [Stutzerimonas stutzeri]